MVTVAFVQVSLIVLDRKQDLISIPLQEYRSEKSLEALNELVPPKCHW